MQDCIFCKIVNKEIDHQKIWENDGYIAFLDAHPIRAGHTLVIPKKHVDYIFDIDDEEYAGLMLASKAVAKIIKEKLKPTRVGVLVEGFGINHAHVHLIPIDNGGEIDIKYAKPVPPTELEEIMKQIVG